MPSYADKLVRQADEFVRAGRLDDAEASLRRAAQIDPRAAATRLLLGNVRLWRGDFEGAAACYRAAININPRDVDALNNLGTVLRRLGRLAEAEAALARAISIDPLKPEPLTNLGAVYQDRGLLDQSLDALRRALSLRPTSLITFNNLLLSLNRDARSTPRQVYDAHVEFARRFASAFPPPAPFTNDNAPDRVLRIGYVSPDFRQHSVRHFIEPILRHHHRSAVFAAGYMTGRPDSATDQLRALCDAWVDARNVPDEALATRIRHDQIDVLVDLAGHTSARILLFARQPAPVQVTYLGYPNTTGLTAMHYRITDAIADPPGDADTLHTERLIRLPTVAWCYQPPNSAPEVNDRPAASEFTFGSLNALSKVTDATVSLWSRVLHAVPVSRLVLKARGLTDPATQELTRSRFAAHGVDPTRVITLPWAPSIASHLAVYHQIDVALDTYPYCGTTTTCEALYMGVPTLTLAGPTHASRVGASLLSAVGLGDWVSSSADQFVETAQLAALNRAALIEQRQARRPRLLVSPLCNAEAFVSELESAYMFMWKTWCGGH